MQLRRFAVIGHPIGHTMSPFIHDRLFSLTGHKPEYSVLDIPSLTQALPALRTLDGFNITIPHKSDIIPLLDGIDEKAKLFGSVNTVRVEDGKMTGYDTGTDAITTGFTGYLGIDGKKERVECDYNYSLIPKLLDQDVSASQQKIYTLASTVVTLSRIAFGIFVC